MRHHTEALGRQAHYHSADHEIPCGPLIISLHALVMQRWMHENGWAPEQTAEVPVAQRYNASLHPDAQERTPITAADVVSSRPITPPLRMLDCSLISDGGAAIVFAAGERARDLEALRPVYVHGPGGACSYCFCWNLPDYTDCPRMLVRTSVDRAFEQAGIGRDDVDFAMAGDPGDICTLIGIEGMGYATPGEAVDFAQDAALRVGVGRRRV